MQYGFPVSIYIYIYVCVCVCEFMDAHILFYT